MKLKEKIQRFWTLSKSRQGFTLVELIVVIAILAILAGVAIPVYNGYIKKAQTAADQQLLDTVNTAYAAACLENNINPLTDLTTDTAKAPIYAGKINIAGIQPAALQEAFEFYYGENANSSFTFYKVLAYDQTKGQFIGSDTVGGVYAQLVENIRKNYSDQITALGNSTFGSAMGVESLMGQLDDVTSLAAGLAQSNDAVQNVLGSAGFVSSATAALGIDASELNSKLGTLAADMMAKNPGMTQEQALAQVQANAAVLYTAQQTAGMTTEKATELFNSASTAEILSKMTSTDSATSGEGLAQAALVCGMYTAYVNREGSTVADKTVNVDTVLAALNNDTAFQSYLTTDQGKADLEGYLGSLSILSSSADGKNSAEVENLMVNGFNDSDLIAGIGSLLG